MAGLERETLHRVAKLRIWREHHCPEHATCISAFLRVFLSRPSRRQFLLLLNWIQASRFSLADQAPYNHELPSLPLPPAAITRNSRRTAPRLYHRTRIRLRPNLSLPPRRTRPSAQRLRPAARCPPARLQLQGAGVGATHHRNPADAGTRNRPAPRHQQPIESS